MSPTKKTTRDEITALVGKILQQHNQVERNRILEMLLELDRDKTQARLEMEILKNELNQAIHSLEMRRTSQVDDKQKDCQETMRERFAVIDSNIERMRPNYIAVLGLLFSVLLPFLGWVYSIQAAVWETKVSVASVRQEVTEIKDKARLLKKDDK
jgi:hypothetical protein